MTALHDRVETELAKLGFRKEHRRFQTHLTIGRVRGGGPGIAELGAGWAAREFAAGRMAVEKLTVFASTLTSAGPIYEVLGTAHGQPGIGQQPGQPGDQGRLGRAGSGTAPMPAEGELRP